VAHIATGQGLSSTPPHRIGLVRPDRPGRVVAEADARVVRHELQCRLGPVTLDLRIDGDALGPWQPLASAAWPRDIDTTIDAGLLFGDHIPCLTALFGRTVEPVAVEVRRRMLVHLGVIPHGDFVVDAERLTSLAAFSLAPTDIWLICRAANDIDLDEPCLHALRARAGGPEQSQLDEVFDTVAAQFAPVVTSLPSTTPTIDRLIDERETLRAELATRVDEHAQREREAVELVEELQAEIRVLHERLDRANTGHPEPGDEQ